MLTKREKIKKAMELLKMGISIREISREVKMSHSTICLIKRKTSLSSKDEKEKSTTETSETSSTHDDSSMTDIPINQAMSKHSQGLKFLIEKKS